MLARGEALDLPAEERKRLNAQTNPTWPHVHVRLDAPFEELTQIFPCNHILATPGDRMRPLVHAAQIAGIPAIVLGEGSQQAIWERVQ
jgi:L-fucose isomerase